MADIVIEGRVFRLLDHARQPSDALLKRIDVLEQENIILKDRLDSLQKSITKGYVFPPEFDFSKREAQIFSMLLDKEVVTKDAIMHFLYGSSGIDELPHEKILDVFIHKVRAKLEKRVPEMKISTQWGIGYYMDKDSKELAKAIFTRDGKDYANLMKKTDL